MSNIPYQYYDNYYYYSYTTLFSDLLLLVVFFVLFIILCVVKCFLLYYWIFLFVRGFIMLCLSQESYNKKQSLKIIFLSSQNRNSYEHTHYPFHHISFIKLCNNSVITLFVDHQNETQQNIMILYNSSLETKF